jgi:hypothetical protein
VRDAARRAFDARPGDVLVVDLAYDSLLDGDRRANADPSVRRLRFGTAEGGADVGVVDRGEKLTVGVQVLPRHKATVEIRCQAPTFTVTTDDVGYVQVEIPPGLMSLLIRPDPAPHPWPLQTAWVRV